MTAPDRDATQQCPHFGVCGGCTRLDVPIDQQLADKVAALREAAAPWLDGVEPSWTAPPRLPRHDRAQILYPVQPHPHLALTMGIYRHGTHAVEEIEDCRIQMKALTRLGQAALAIFRHHGLSAYDETTGRGLLRAFRARIAPATQELLAGVITTGRPFTSHSAVAADLREAAQGLRDEQGRPLRLRGVVHNVNDRPGNALLGGQTRALWGRTFLTDQAGELTFRVSFGSFYQTNRYADALLYRPAMAMLGSLLGLRAVDAYGGVGTFGLRLAAAGATVTIVESHAEAAADARHNAAQNALPGVTVVQAPFDRAEFGPCDLMVADPPRAGLQEAGAARVKTAAPQRLLLVSCAVPSLARDLALLADTYRVTGMHLCDLFPHTEHVEVLTLLERRASESAPRAGLPPVEEAPDAPATSPRTGTQP